ncbi:D-cysteine desulfhydrase family protein [Sphingobacterium sp. HJSM2_6]|uniref:D-cysteine desulfhydrase family protein n=1 Tax=Sphingobacterium sp. HJSM2_6 TaxID=3366264 RepID=UPI003BD81441
MELLKIFDSFLTSKGFVRYSFLEKPTPIQHLKKLSKLLNHPIYMKRDDLNGIGMGGNKVRKLEFFIADAIAQSANRVITLGALQSNHARLTAFAASMANLEIDLVLKKSVNNDTSAYQSNGNMLLNRLLDAQIHCIPNDEKVSHYIQNLQIEYSKKGENPYFIPVGGSSALGSLGYARAAVEIEEQLTRMDVSISNIGLASGSGGTHAGLLAGYNYLNKPMNIHAYNVQIEQEPLFGQTRLIANEVSKLIDCSAYLAEEHIHLSNAYAGEAYGIPNAETFATLQLLAKTEGILLDPVYTGKAFTGFIEDIKMGKYQKGPSLFIHTGGTSGFFAYEDWLKHSNAAV